MSVTYNDPAQNLIEDGLSLIECYEQDIEAGYYPDVAEALIDETIDLLLLRLTRPSVTVHDCRSSYTCTYVGQNCRATRAFA